MESSLRTVLQEENRMFWVLAEDTPQSGLYQHPSPLVLPVFWVARPPS